jgi:hypothetical protein
MDWRRWWLAPVVGVALIAAMRYVAAEQHVGLGFPLDDGWIHAQFAHNLAAGHGLAFNPGEPSTGSTAPLWTLVLALPVALGADVVLAAKAVGIALAALAAALAGALAHALTRSRVAGLVAGFAVALSPRLTWGAVSGMEVPLYTALACAALLAFLRSDGRHEWGWGLLCGLCTLARPETGVLFPVLLVTAMTIARRETTPGARTDIRGLAGAVLAFAIVVGADVAVNLAISGRPLPATFYAKTDGAGLLNAVGRADVQEIVRSLAIRSFAALNEVARYLAEQSLILFLFALPGMMAIGRVWKDAAQNQPASPRGIAVVAVQILSPLAMGALAPVSPLLMQEGRYAAHLLVLFFVVAVVGAEALARRSRAPLVVWALAALAVVRLASQNVAFADRYVRQVDNINRTHVAMGGWLAANTPPGALIATNDIGAIGVFSGRPVLDLEGLVTPAIIPFKPGRQRLAFLERERPDFLVIFDEWYPELVARRDLFTEVHRITVPRVSAAHDSFIVYRARWSAIPGRNSPSG